MTTSYTLLHDIGHQVEAPTEGILSRTVHQDHHTKVVLFAFSPGQELSEHTASTPAVIQVLSGEADITLGDDKIDATAGTWVHMPAQLPHSLRAKSPMVMLLTLLKSAKV